jgi:hypothetical protein
MREIALSKGLVALVDDADFDRLSSYSWYAHSSNGGKVYAARKVAIKNPPGRHGYGVEYMHHAVAGKPDAGVVDHFNGNSLDNQRLNLRPCTQSVNILNSAHSEKPGVFLCRMTGRYAARASRDKKRVFLGRFDTWEEAVGAVTKFRSGAQKPAHRTVDSEGKVK